MTLNLPTFPFEVKKGNSVVKIYRHSNAGYDEFKVAFYAAGKRKLEGFADFEKAKERAGQINDSVNNGNTDTLTLTGKDRLTFTRAVAALQPSGIPLDLAALQFAEAVSILSGGSIIEAARYCAKRQAQALPDRAVLEAVTEFITAKTSAGRSGRHLKDLNYRLGKFAKDFNCNLADVREMELRKFLDGLNLSPRSQNNFRSTLISFFRWTQRKKYLPRDWDELSSIETVEGSDGAIEIFTPEEMAALLTHADEKILPFLVIGAFAGLRSSEICRLDWKQIGVGDGKFIEVKADNARKTKQRRLVPMSDNLKAWLQPLNKSQGKIWSQCESNLYWFIRDLAKVSNIGWKNNALRHSFISYRMAEAQDAAKVSLEAGNSPQMIFSNYRELVTPNEAARWFSIKPDDSAEGKITWLKAAA
jgi:integrase